MNIHFNLVSLIDFLALTQGILLGIILIAGNRKNRPSSFLGLFLLTYTADLVAAIIYDTGIITQYPSLTFLPFYFHFLSAPLFYLYAKSLVMPVSIKKSWPIFIPGILEFLFYSFLFIFPVAKKLQLQQNETILLILGCLHYGSLIYSIVFAVMTIRLVTRHQNKVLDYFSNASNRQLKWVKVVAIILIIFYLLWFLNFFVSDEIIENITYPTFSAINVILIYWIGISGLRQPKIDMPVANKEPSQLPNKQAPTLTSEKNEALFSTLSDLMKEKQLFKETELTLPILAQHLGVSRRDLSQSINNSAGTNFNRFINQYRVKEAQKLLADPAYDHLNMLGIAYEVGFNSKATFFLVFKQLAGVSPGKYKKRQFENGKSH